MVFVIAVCAFMGIFLTCCALIVATTPSTLTTKLRDIGLTPVARSFDDRLEQPLFERIFGAPVQAWASFIRSLAPQSVRALADQRLLAAGGYDKMDTDRFLTYWGTFILVGTIGAALAALITKGGLLSIVLGALGGAALCYLVPLAVLDSRARKRKAAIQRQMPEVLDLVTVSVEAGLSFNGAIAKVAEKMKGPLVDELARMLQEMQMGITRGAALKELAKRCDLQDVSLFTAALIQADQLGVSIARILRIQSGNIRERHRQRMREAALKAPIKIMFPLVLFIFPALFVVALGPALLDIMKIMGK